jgi:hypothetical protein
VDTPVRIGWNLAIAEQIVFCSRFEHLIIPHGDSRELLLCTDAVDGVCCSKR